MENATKALIIAAAVLISIVLVALGVLLIKNTSSTSEDAEKVGESLDLGVDDAMGNLDFEASILKSELKNLYFLTKVPGKVPPEDKLADEIKIKGYVYQEFEENFNKNKPSDENSSYDYLVKKWIPTQKSRGMLKSITNPLDIKVRNKLLTRVYEHITGEKHQTGKAQVVERFWFGYDESKKIDKMIYISVITPL